MAYSQDGITSDELSKSTGLTESDLLCQPYSVPAAMTNANRLQVVCQPCQTSDIQMKYNPTVGYYGNAEFAEVGARDQIIFRFSGALSP